MAENEIVKDTEDQDVNADANSEVTGQDQDVTAENDPVKAAIDAAIAARLEELESTARDKARQEASEEREFERRVAAEQARAEELINSFGTTVRTVRENLKGVKLTDSDGNTLALSDEDIEKLVVSPLQRYNQTGQQAATTQTFRQLAEAAMNSLPESAREAFARRATNKPLDEWLTEYAELKAEQTGWAKKSKADMDAAIKAAEARGFKRGQTAPANPPVQGQDSQRAVNQNVDRNSISGAAKALSQGLITDSEYVEIYNKLTQ